MQDPPPNPKPTGDSAVDKALLHGAIVRQVGDLKLL